VLKFKVDLISPRAWRALALIVLCVTVAIVSSIAYLHPSPRLKPSQGSLTGGMLPVSRLGDNVSYDFVTPSTGWALVATSVAGRQDQFAVFRTDDGAKHWLKQLTGSQGVPVGVDPQFVVKFFDKFNGLVLVPTLSDVVYRTTDGGANWQPVGLPVQRGAVISFSDPTNAWLLVSASATDRTVNLYATRNGGVSWQRLPDPPADVCIPVPVQCAHDAIGGLGPAMAPRAAIAFRGPSEGWIGGRGDPLPHVYSSNDGGRSWYRHDLPIPTHGVAPGAMASVHLLPGAGVVASVDEGNGPDYPLISIDGGASWRFVGTIPTDRATFTGLISFQDALHWWDTDGSTLFKTSDAGATWSLSSLGLDGLFYCRFLDSKNAFGIFLDRQGSLGQGLALTTDAGLHWTQASVPDPA
jgi:photosystem II stability/assembly factor-like uncharacterized protein